MKTSTDSIKAEFKPITHTITIESEDELEVMLGLFSAINKISNDLAWTSIDLEADKIEQILKYAFEGLDHYVTNLD